MRIFVPLFIFFLSLCGCKDNEQDSYISAQIDGINKTSKNFSIERIPQTNELALFSAVFGDGTSIGFRLNTQPSYDTGIYNFRLSDALPATLVSFSLQVVNFQPQLKWSTAQETNLQSFIVERSTDGTVFQNMGSVAATNTATVQNYVFTDASVNILSRFYYRLKMFDSSGQFSYSGIIVYSGDADYIAYLGEGAEKLKGYNGNLQVTGHDRNRRIVTGSFSFDVRTNSQQAKQVRNGSFRIIY